MSEHKLTAEQKDVCSGIALLYLKSMAGPDEFTERLVRAIKEDEADEAEHISAVMVTLMYGAEDDQAKFASKRWNEAFMEQP